LAQLDAEPIGEVDELSRATMSARALAGPPRVNFPYVLSAFAVSVETRLYFCEAFSS
jgi:hypothetical protein